MNNIDSKNKAVKEKEIDIINSIVSSSQEKKPKSYKKLFLSLFYIAFTTGIVVGLILIINIAKIYSLT